ncbi:MAG: hypothetical protein HOV80_17610 [Polyangiaceae bacterium]|nr:hypothetical protein [Polyangiaceae bacterium]
MSWIARLLGRPLEQETYTPDESPVDERLRNAYTAHAVADSDIAEEWERELRKVQQVCASSKGSDKPPPQITIRPMSGVDLEEFLP